MKTSIHPTALIGPNVEIGEGVYIGPYCVIGFPAESKGKEDENYGVKINKGAIIHGLVTIDTGTERPTIVGEGSYLMKHSHIGHDAQIGKNNTIACGAKIGGFVKTGEYVNIALNGCVHQRLIIPEGVMLGMNSTLTKTIELHSYGIYAGTPARFLKKNKVLIDRLKR